MTRVSGRKKYRAPPITAARIAATTPKAILSRDLGSMASPAQLLDARQLRGHGVRREPFERRRDVVVEHPVVAFAESQAREIREFRGRHHDGAPQPDLTQRFVEQPLRQRNIDERRMHFENVVENLAAPGLARELDDLA